MGESTLARAIAAESLRGGLSVKVADLDTQQATFADWHRKRLDMGREAVASVEVFGSVKKALSMTDDFDLLILDGRARSSAATLELGKSASFSCFSACWTTLTRSDILRRTTKIQGGLVDLEGFELRLPADFPLLKLPAHFSGVVLRLLPPRSPDTKKSQNSALSALGRRGEGKGSRTTPKSPEIERERLLGPDLEGGKRGASGTGGSWEGGGGDFLKKKQQAGKTFSFFGSDFRSFLLLF